MSRFTLKDVLAFVLFIVLILSGTAAGYFRWFRSRGVGGTVREAVETATERRDEPAKEPAETDKGGG
jgi:hypothetical protein